MFNAAESELIRAYQIEALEEKERLALSALYHNASAALNVGTDFYMVKDSEAPNNPAIQAAYSCDVERMHAWKRANSVITGMIEKGMYEDIIRLKEEEGKEYAIDMYNPLNVAAMIHGAKFFEIVYNTWRKEQEAARIVPVAKFVDKAGKRAGSLEAAYTVILARLTRFLLLLNDESSLATCAVLASLDVEDVAINATDGTVTEEARNEALAAHQIGEYYVQCYDERIQEKTLSLKKSVMALDFLLD